MRERRWISSRAVTAFVGPALALGCSAPSDDARDAATPATAPGQDDAGPDPGRPLAVGEPVEWQDARTRIVAVRRPFSDAQHAPDAGQEWLGVQVETCAGESPVEAAWYVFAAHGPSSERYPATAWVDPSWPRSQYPQGTVDPGECVGGWVLIPVVVAAPVATVRFSDPDGIPLGEWRLSEEVGG